VQPNCEPSAYKRGHYRIYDAQGNVWIGYRVNTKVWRAYPAANNPARYDALGFKGASLKALCLLVANHRRVPTVAITPELAGVEL